jgi:putative ABC transport system permease protein
VSARGPLAVAWRLARREMRGSLRGLLVFLACLTLGVAAIAAVGVMNAAVMAGLARDASALLGGDIEIESTNLPLSEAELEAVMPPGSTLSRSVRTNSMAYAGERRVVTELKAVDAAYPLYGEVRLDPPMPLEQALADGGVVVERGILARLGLERGGRLRVGDAELEIRAVIEREPDRLGGFVSIGPRTMIALDELDRTGIIRPGSLARYAYGLALPGGIDPAALEERIEAEHREAAWRVRAASDVQPSFARFTARLASYLTIAGLTALLIGGLGVALAVQNYLGGKTTTIATLKCLGAPSRLVFRVYLLQVLALATAGVVIGLGLGQATVWLFRLVPEELVPVPVIEGVYPVPLLIAAGCGYLAALAFTLLPLARARDVSAANIFRSLIAPGSIALRRQDVIWIGACLAGLAALAVAGVGDRTLGLVFVGVALVAALALAGLARLMLHLVGRLGVARSRPSFRLALANLRRPGSGNASVVVALGAGLAVLTMVALLQHNLVTELEERLPDRAPAFFFIDIQPDQIGPFQEVVASTDGAELINKAPMLRGRVVRIAGQPADEVAVDPEVRWTVRRDRGLTFQEDPPPEGELIEGSWWPADYRGPPLVSVDEEVARGYGVGLGDRLGFSVLGRVIEAEIASTREVAWEDGGMNWLFVFSPGVLDAAPFTWVATVESAAAVDDALIVAVTERLPNVTPISVRQVVAQLGEALARIGLAVSAVGGITLLAGILVLAGAIAAARRRHLYESVVLKVLGARRFDLLRIFALEYLGLGLAAALVGAVLGTAGAAIVVIFVMDLSFSFSASAVLQVLLVALLVTLVAGFIGTWRLLGRPASTVLRAA